MEVSQTGTGKPRLVDNIVSLYLLQGLNYLIPMAVLPYLVRTLGIEIYGLVAFCQSFVQYFNLLADYGFNFTATRAIAQQRENLDATSKIFYSVYAIKFALMAAGLVVLLLVVLVVPLFNRNAMYFLVAYMGVFGNTMFPLWYFQGIERMRYISVITSVAKVISASLLFAFVRSPQDGLLAIGIQSFGLVIAGALGCVVACRSVHLRRSWPTFRELRAALAEGWHIFVSTAAVSLYTSSMVFFVGIFAGNVQAGYFSVADKIVRAAQGVLNPLTQAMFPHISSISKRAEQNAIVFLRKCLIGIGSLSLTISLLLFIFAPQISTILMGASGHGCISTIRCTAMLPFIIAVGNVLGVQTMIPFGLDKQVSRIYVSAGLVSPLLGIPLILGAGSAGAGISMTLVETFIIFAMWRALNRRGINLGRQSAS